MILFKSENKAVMYLPYMSVFITAAVAREQNDYWSDDFDQDKSCKDVQSLSEFDNAQCETIQIM